MLLHYELLYSLAVTSNLRQHIPEQRIQPGIVVFGIGHALAQVVQDDQPQTGTEPPGRGFVQLGPGLGLDRNVNSRTAFRLKPSVRTNRRARRYLPVLGSRTIGPVP